MTPRPVVCVDKDSTLADTRPRRQHCPTVDPVRTWTDYAMACGQDRPVPGVVRLLDLLAAGGHAIHIVTFAPGDARAPTVAWLRRHHIGYDVLRMRGLDDPADSVAYKLAYLRECHRAGLRVRLFIEDSPVIAEAVEATGVPVLCVNPRYADQPIPVVS